MRMICSAAAVAAGRMQALGAEVAGVVGPHERRDDDVARLQRRDVAADVLDDADELVADPVAVLRLRLGAVGPQVAPADTGAQHAHHRVGWFAQRGVGHVLDPHVACAVDQSCSHDEH